MACSECEVTAMVDGVLRHVTLRFENLDDLEVESERPCAVYRCRACGTFWEVCAGDQTAVELQQSVAAALY
jgi:hypothetical protein